MHRREAIGTIAAAALFAPMAEAQTSDTPVLAESALYKFDAAAETLNAAGGGTRQTLPRTTLPSGEVIGVHVGTIPAGKVYSPMHANGNAEILIVYQGKMEFLTESNPPKLAEAGDVIYAAAHEGHSLRNPGDVTTTYFVVAVGGPKPAPKA